MRSKQYFTSIKNNPHEISTDPKKDQWNLSGVNVKTWGILILRINFRQSKQKESSILHSPELWAKVLYFGIKRLWCSVCRTSFQSSLLFQDNASVLTLLLFQRQENLIYPPRHTIWQALSGLHPYVCTGDESILISWKDSMLSLYQDAGTDTLWFGP